MTSLEVRLHEALVDPDPRESESRIKATVADALATFDPSATVKVTTYFNHTFAPDMVLAWGKSERPVFLRFTDNVPELAHDIELLDRHDPLVFGLSTPPAGTIAENRVHERSRDAAVLFAAPAAIEELNSRSEPATTDRMLRNSLAHGGRGALVATADATRLADEVRVGFDSASHGQVTGTRSAIATIEDYFQEGHARRLNRVLQAVWEGSGARLDQFPGDPDLTDQLGELPLQYLLQFMDSDDPAFWRGVGRGLTLDQLVALARADLAKQDNFQHLVNANLDVLRGRACIVLDMSMFGTDLDAAGRSFRWGVDLPARDMPPAITLRGPSFHAFVTRTKELLEPRLREHDPGLPVDVFLGRAGGASVASVDVSVGGKHMTLREDSGTTSREFLVATTSQLAAPLVDKATVTTGSGRVTVDFVRLTGTGVTKTENLVADLLGATVGLIVDLDPDSRSELGAFLSISAPSDQTDALPGIEDDETEDDPGLI